METGINLTAYDYVVLGLAALFIIRGIWLGLLRQVTGLTALFLSYYIASRYHDRLFPFLKGLSENPTVIFIASAVILFLAAYIITLLLGKAVSHVVEILITKWFDKILGGALGGVMAVFVVVLLHMILSAVLTPENAMLRECRTCPPLNTAAEYAGTLIKDEQVRKSLLQKSPAISMEDVLQFFEKQPSAEGVRAAEPPAQPL